MKVAYITKRFSESSQDIINAANDIIDEYSEMGYELTLRQLYYQFVARDHLANTESNYKRLGNIISDGRLAGLIDWDAIVDRTRDVQNISHWKDPGDIINTAAKSYRLDTRATQPNYVEVWVEKEALLGVVEAMCNRLDVVCLTCRGYYSQSSMWNASLRFIKQYETGKKCTLLHLGDHDPSGIDMTRDITERLELFGANIHVKRIALTWDQIEELNPPPNPAKVTDSRYRNYELNYGDKSWELDALDPRFITKLITDEVNKITVQSKRKTLLKKEAAHKSMLHQFALKWDEIVF